MTLPQSKQAFDATGAGAVAAMPAPPNAGGSPYTLAARSPAASAYVASISTPKADAGTTPEPRMKRFSSSGVVSRLAAAIEHKGPSPVVGREGAGGFG
ncbi:unnamed protein product, partial [Ectocarpus sp. 8 AP-2014]